MPPFKRDVRGSQRITSFFKKFTIPREQWANPNHIEDEIVVATSSTTPCTPDADSNRSKQQASRDGTASKQVAPNRKGRPSKCSGGSPSHSSASSNIGPPRRGRGRPRKSAQSSLVAGPSSKTAHMKSSAPHKSSPKFNINPVTGTADVTSTMDSPYRDSSASSSTSRIAVGVEVQSSRRRSATDSPTDDMAAPAPPAACAEPALQPLQTTSAAPFSSSTLSSEPLSSHPTTASAPISTASSSKRIIKDGLQAVAASDSESDSSDDDLQDPATFFSKKPAEPASRIVKSAGTTVNPFTASKTSGGQGVKRKFAEASSTSLPNKVFRKSLAQMAAEHQKREHSEAMIASMEHAVGESKKQEEVSKQLEELGADEDGDETIGEAESDTSNDGAERKRLAMQRTEAMQRKNEYYFFLDDRPVFEDTPFPVEALPEAPWSKLYADEQSRKQACRTGFAAEMAAIHPLPVTVTNWLAHQLSYEPDEGLCEAYVHILEACSHHQESVSNTIASISSMYRTRSSFEHNWTEQLRTGLPSGLKNIVRVVSFCAPAADSVVSDASPSMSAAAFLDLAMINIDELVQNDVNLSLEVESCIEKMLEVLPEESFERLIPEVIGILFLPRDLPPINRCRIIAALPSNTLRAYKIRRRLALECFSTSISRSKTEDQNWPMSIHRALRTRSEFSITPDTDYDLLEAYIDILEIAVAVGFTPYQELTTARTATGGLLTTKRSVSTAAGKQHDEHVDALIRRLNYLTNRIRGGGTTHMRMTEVKTRIDKFLTRLANSVRTTAPVKRGIFDGDDGKEQSTLAFGGSLAKVRQLPIKSLIESLPTVKKKVEFEKAQTPPNIDDGTTDGGTDSLEGTPKLLPLPGESVSFTEDGVMAETLDGPTSPSTPQSREITEIPSPIVLGKDALEVADDELLSDREPDSDDEEFETCVEFELHDQKE